MQAYLASVLVGLATGAVAFGSWNLYLAGEQGVAKSLIGGLFGAIAAAEIFKRVAHIRTSTGFYFVPGLLAAIVIGRVGCFFGGLDDFTHGIPTVLPWGVDFGDGLRRHPVQLYEAAVMLLLLAGLVMDFAHRQAFWLRYGFYVFVLVYATQRFAWEFLKPYPPVLGALNMFHLLSLALLAYAVLMVILGSQRVE